MRSIRKRVRRFAAAGAAAAAIAATALPSPASAAPLTDGNVVVYRVGATGGGALTSNATAVFLDEYTPTGTLVQSIPLPTAVSGAQKRVTASGTATSEGLLTRSADGCSVVFTGYDAAVGTASVSGTLATAVNRVVGKVDAAGALDTSTALSNVSDGNNFRSAATTDGNAFWVGGAGTTSTGGVHYVASVGATTATQLSTTVTNIRGVHIFDGQLYVSSASGTIRVATAGSGLPTTAGQTITNLPASPGGASPYGLFMADRDGLPGIDTLYVAAESQNLLKYELISGSWALRATIPSSGARGLTGVAGPTGVTLFVTRNGNQLDKVDDPFAFGSAGTPTVTPVATAATNTAFRGVAFAPRVCGPDPVIPEAPFVALLPIGAIAAMGAAYLVLRPRPARTT